MQTIEREPMLVPALRWPAWAPLAGRWALIALAAFGVVMLGIIIGMHPPRDHVTYLALSLVISGVVSLGIGAGAMWLIAVAQIDSLRLKLAIPALLAALVIGLNALVAAKLMFISVVDSQLLLAYLIFGACLALALSTSAAGTISRALQRLAVGAQRLAAGEYGERIPDTRLGGVQELTQLAQGFNQMAGSVQDAIARRDAAEAQRRMMLAALSHDVRTPLTAMRAMLEAIDDGVVSDAAGIQRYHHAMRAEMRHLSLLIDDLFEMARIEAGAVRLERAALNLEDVLSDALEAAHEQAERNGVQLTGQLDGELPVIQADARQLHRVLSNLVQNALRHTPEGGTILLHATSDGAMVTARVIDTGAGIAPADLPYVFDPAYRGEPSRTRPTADANLGAGLGLAIARGLITAHGGAIQAQSPLPDEVREILAKMAPEAKGEQGTVVSFTLPVGVTS